MTEFKHRYTSDVDFDVIEITEKYQRKVDPDYPEYVKAQEAGAVFEKISGGEFVEITEGVVSIRADKEAVLLARQWAQIRTQRDALLTACDWTQIEDSPLYQNADWLTYRQALRDITEQTDPYAIVWPTEPAGTA